MDLKVQIVVPPPVFLFSFFFFFNFISYEFQVGNTTYFHGPCGPHDYTDTFFFSFLLIFHAKKQLRMLLHLHL